MRLNKDRGLRIKRKDDDFSPMDGVGNMADAMLVFALGILLALMISWNVDVSDQGEIQDQTKYRVQNIDSKVTETIESEEDLEEMGKVYRDPKTGKYYVIEKK